MDKVYGSHNRTSSDVFCFHKYFNEYSDLVNLKHLNELRNSGDDKAGILEIMQMNIGDEDFAALSEYCSVENLRIPGENFEQCIEPVLSNRKDTYEVKNIPDNVDLQTLKRLKERLNWAQRPFIHSLKYRGEISIKPDKKEEIKPRPFVEPDKEIIVFVRIYAPFVCQSRSIISNQPKIATSHIIAILGSQTLAQLRDLISCNSDLSISTEVSDNPKAVSRLQAKDIYKSGFFYIEGTFYNDYRDPANKDNSEVIREWAERRGLGPFETSTMEGVTINSLAVRFGYPWVYQHQGTCEHLLVFSDARLVGTTDNFVVSNYPRIERMRASSTKCCIVCGVYAANWITTNNERLPHDPCYFCDTCFHSFNYIDGKKVGNFNAYPVPSNTEVNQELITNE